MGSSDAAGPSTASPPAGRGQAQGLDALPRRTSSAPPAPQSPLEHLPNGLLENILGRLVTGSPFESVRNLSAVMQTSGTLRQSVVGDPALWSNDQKLGAVNQPVIESVGQAVTEFADRIGNLAVDERATHCRPLLQFLATGQRDSLVDAVLDLPDGDGVIKAKAIGALGPGLAHLKKTQRDALVVATLQLPGALHKALAINGLGAGLAHLEPSQRNALAAAAISLPPDDDMDFIRSHALTGLAAGLATLKPPQSNELVDAVLGLPNESDRAVAIGQFGRGLQHLRESRRNTVVDAAISLTGNGLKATAIAGLGAGLEGLNLQQHGVLVETAIGLAYDRYKASAIAGLGAGLEHLSQPQRDDLMKAAIGLANEYHRAKAISGLGAGLAYLQPGQHTALVAAVTSMQGRHPKASAIVGLARGLASLDQAQRGTLVDIARGKSAYKIEERQPAIGALGAELAHLSAELVYLSADQREALVNATVRNASAKQHETIAGLGKAMMCLTPTQAQALLSAARNIEDDHQAAVALAGLAEGAAKLRPRPAPVV